MSVMCYTVHKRKYPANIKFFLNGSHLIRVVPDVQASALHGSSAAIGVWVCV